MKRYTYFDALACHTATKPFGERAIPPRLDRGDDGNRRVETARSHLYRLAGHNDAIPAHCRDSRNPASHAFSNGGQF